jgi:hypothetical protein
MPSIRHLFVVGALGIACTTAGAFGVQPPTCGFAQTDQQWAAEVLEGSQRVNIRAMHVAVRELPTLVLFDENCAHAASGASDRA